MSVGDSNRLQVHKHAHHKGSYLNFSSHKWPALFFRTIALVVVAFTTIDLAIDLIHTFLLSLSWSAVALLPRLLLGMGYLAVFMAHVGLQKVFPPGYTYWGLRAEYAGPIVYLFLWALGFVPPLYMFSPFFFSLRPHQAILIKCITNLTRKRVWDMLHVCVNRHQVGLDTRKWRDKITQRQVTSSMRRTQQQQGDFTHFRTSFGVENLTLPQMMSTTASVEANQGDLGTSRRATGSGAPMAIPSSSNFGERDKTSNRNITTGITPPAESGDSRLREGVGGINAPYS